MGGGPGGNRRFRIAATLGSLVLSLAAVTATLGAQTLAGRAIDRQSKLPLQRVPVAVLGDSARVVLETRTDTAGVFYADLPAAGRYRVRFSVDSVHTFESDTVVVRDSGFVQREFIVPLLPVVYFEFQVEKQVAVAPHSPQPRYPAELREQQVEGEVLAQFVVDPTGHVRPGSLKVLRATDFRFVDAVRDAVYAMRFIPAERGGKRVFQMVQQPFEFRLTP
jgi:TonB family protein